VDGRVTMIHIGFTGTRKGMTGEQKMTLCKLLGGIQKPAWFHHGLCVGSDEEAHCLAWDMDFQIEGHPPADQKLMAKWLTGFAKLNPALPYMARNRAIVTASNKMIATPAEWGNPGRGGTWATIAMGIKEGRRVAIILPDGSVNIHHMRKT